MRPALFAAGQSGSGRPAGRPGPAGGSGRPPAGRRGRRRPAHAAKRHRFRSFRRFQPVPFLGGYFEALAIVCFALALLWALLWLVKRYGRGSGFLGGSTGMRVESRLALGPKKWIIVVRDLDRRLVLGLTDANISLLTELPFEDEPGTASSPAAPAKAKNGGAKKAAAPVIG